MNRDKTNVSARRLTALLASTAIVLQPFGVLAGDALPTGGQVVSGSAAIATSGTTMTVTQGSDRAIVNWDGFSVGHGSSVTFVQPGSSSAILNRVTGSTPSTIAGSLSGNGQVYLINPNGIAITPTGTVRVGGGFVASTLDLSNDDFMAGHYRFGGDGSSAGVSNEGVITIGRGGYAALIGGTVKNDGMIAVPMGKVGLGSGEQATLDLSGDGFLQVAVPTADGAEGTGALIENGGRISAEGGTVVMQAATARHAARHAINLSGTVEANSVSGRDGAIVIGGGEGGEVSLSGRLSSQSSAGTGGKVTVTGKSVALKGATVDASGATGGGTVRIGGDYKGQGALQRAATTTVDAASTIRADATQSGDGGSIVVWSDDLTRFSGLITAMGAGSGRGGDAEVSGKARLAYTGFANLSGPGGFGTLLLDPYNITISSGPDSNVSGFSASGNDSVLNVTTLTNALAGANVAVTTGMGGSQTGDIAVNSAISWAANTTLTLSAANNIAINADITATGAQAGLVLNYGDYANTGSATSGTDYSIAPGASITLSGANSSLAINGTGYTLIRSRADLEAVNNNRAGNYALAGDLDLLGASYTAAIIGPWGSNFDGIFAGLGHTISNLTVNGSSGFAGLFGANRGTIRDIGLIGGSVSGSDYVAGLVGYNNGGTIKNAHTSASVHGSRNFVGGLVGLNEGGTITSVYATGSVTGSGSSQGVGGLVGSSRRGTISNAYATGSVSGGGTFVGGLVGLSELGGTISNAYATGSVSGTGFAVGGLVGSYAGTIGSVFATGNVSGSALVGGLVGGGSGTINTAYATGRVTGTGDRVGGLIGQNSGTITNAYATGVVSSPGQRVGGLVGENTDGSAITNAYATGAVSSSSNNVGGLIGTTGSGTVITNAYATGAVSSSGISVGGLIGNAFAATLNNTYATGAVSGVARVGGLIGERFSGAVNASFFNTSTTGQTLGVGSGSSSGVTGLTTAQMSSLSSFANAGWNIDDQGGTGTVWRIYEGYASPLLRSFLTALTITGGAGSKIYDGSTFSTSVGTLSYSLTNIDLSKILGTAVYATSSANVGTYTGLTLSGLYSAPSGYDISYGAGTGAVTVNRAGLTVTANNDTKTYDGLAYTGGNGVSYSGFVNGETASVLGGALSFGGSSQGALNAGSYVLSASGLTSGNYDISYVDGSLTINRAGLTVTANDDTKTYDGLAYSGGNGVSYSGFVNGETASVLGGALSFGGSSQGALNAGSYVLSASGLTAANYDISYVDGSLTVNRAGLTVTANNDTKTYDGLAYTGGNGVSYTGFVNGETASVLGGALSFGGSSQGALNAGSYVLSASGLTSGNYDISYVDGSLTVNRAGLTVTANNDTKTYDGLAYSGGNGVYYSGFVNGETASVLGGALNFGGSSQGALNAGSYVLSASGLTAANYDISYVDGSLTINRAGLTVTANDDTKTYDGLAYTGGNGVSYLGFVNGETASVLGGALNFGGTSQGALNAGSYVLSASGLTSGNYDISYVDGSLTVTPRAISITADDNSKIYGDSVSLGYTIRGGSLVNGDSLSGSLASAGTAVTASVGRYAITQGTLANANYDISFVDGALTVTPRALSITADDRSKIYGDSVSLGYAIRGGSLVNGDSLSGSLASAGTALTAAVGRYAITQGTLANANYDISYVGGILTVTPASLTITADSSSIVSGSSIPSLGYSTAGWRNGQDGSLLSGVVVSTDATSSSGAGRFATRAANGTLSGAAAGNYRLIYVDGVLTVTPQIGAQLLQTVVLPFNPAINFAASLDTRSGFSPSSPIIGAVASGSGGNGGAGGTLSVEDPQLSGAVCALGPNLAIAC